MRRVVAICLVATMIASCQPAEELNEPAATGAAGTSSSALPAPAVTQSGEGAPFAAIAAGETIRLVGTEPFWGGTVKDGEMLYSTTENQAGDAVAVKRFAGNSGLGFSGTWRGKPLDLTVTPGTCSDGMSDRSFPYTATLRLGDEQRNGCAWTDRQPFTGPENP